MSVWAEITDKNRLNIIQIPVFYGEIGSGDNSMGLLHLTGVGFSWIVYGTQNTQRNLGFDCYEDPTPREFDIKKAMDRIQKLRDIVAGGRYIGEKKRTFFQKMFKPKKEGAFIYLDSLEKCFKEALDFENPTISIQ